VGDSGIVADFAVGKVAEGGDGGPHRIFF
jgi:hypothetical protein